jgi:Flp pilus assembly protein TadD
LRSPTEIAAGCSGKRTSHEEAVDTEAIRLAPNNPENLNGHGYSLVKLAQYDRAIADFDAALKLKPDHFDALRNRAGPIGLKAISTGVLAD